MKDQSFFIIIAVLILLFASTIITDTNLKNTTNDLNNFKREIIHQFNHQKIPCNETFMNHNMSGIYYYELNGGKIVKTCSQYFIASYCNPLGCKNFTETWILNDDTMRYRK